MSKVLKKTFASLDEALAALPQKTREHGERVAEYAEIIFDQALADQIYPNDPKVTCRMKAENREIFKLAALYHDIGKAAYPEEYHGIGEGYTDEEIALYRNHTENGVQILTDYFRKATGCTAQQEKFVISAVASHHELWNATGYPEALKGSNCNIFSRIIGLADTLDHLFCETHSETPFEDALKKVEEKAGKTLDPDLIELLGVVKRKLKKVFSTNLGATLIIPDINPFVRRLPNSPIAFNCRPIEYFEGKGTRAFETKLLFKKGKEWFPYDDVAYIFKADAKTRKDIGIYASLAACDMLRRFDAAGMDVEFVAVDLPAGWMNVKGAWKDVVAAITDSEISPDRFCYIINNVDFAERRGTLAENIAKLNESGVRVMFDRITIKEVNDELLAAAAEEAAAKAKAEGEEVAEEAPAPAPKPKTSSKSAKAAPKTAEEAEAPKAEKKIPGIVEAAELQSYALTMYRMGAKDVLENDTFIAAMRALADKGVTMMADDIDTEKDRAILKYFDVRYSSGPVRGNFVPEDTFFQGELAVADGKIN